MTESSHRCSHCGGIMEPGRDLCPHCGARQYVSSTGTTIKKILVSLFLVGVSLLLGLAGSCSAMIGVMTMGEKNSGGTGVLLLAGGLLAVIGAIWIFVKMIQMNSR